MANFWTPIVQAVLATVIAAIVVGGGTLALKRSKQQVDGSGLTAQLLKGLRNNWAYARHGFRWQAALFIDHSTGKARVVFYKRSVDLRPEEKQVIRMWALPSRVFQRREYFAWQVYKKAVEWCSTNGWSTIEFTGYMPPDAHVWPGQTEWVVKLANANNQMAVVIQPGWSPITRLPEVRVDSNWTRFKLVFSGKVIESPNTAGERDDSATAS